MGHGFYLVCYQFHRLVISNAGHLINQIVHILNFKRQFFQLLFLSCQLFLLLHQDIILLFQIITPAIGRLLFQMQPMPFGNIKQDRPADRIESLFSVVVLSFWLLRFRERDTQFLQCLFLLGT